MKPYYINLGKIDLENAVEINFIELLEMLPFKAKRVYTITTDNETSNRGKHAHLNQDQLVICVKGKAIASLTNKKGVLMEYDINRNALLIPKGHWIEIEMKPDSVLLCIASKSYNDLISIFDKSEFLS